jgi:hypothetical protein
MKKVTTFLTISIFLLLLSPVRTWADSDANNPTSAVDLNDNSRAWDTPTNVYASDNFDAYWDANEDCAVTSNTMRVTGFNFNLPSGSSIDGVEVDFEGSGSDGYVVHPRLTWNSSPQGNEQVWDDAVQGFFGSSDSTMSYGSSSDTWGNSLTETIVEYGSFGVQFRAANEEICSDVYIDHVQMTVYYTAAAPAPTVTISAGDADFSQWSDGDYVCSIHNGWTTESPFSITITFSEEMTGFTLGDISVSNGTASNLQTSDNTTFTADITPSLGGVTVSMSIPALVATGVSSGQGNQASNGGSSYTIEYDASWAACDTDIIWDGLAWQFDETSGTTANSAAPAEHYIANISVDGTLVNFTDPDDWQQCGSSETSDALNFDGVDAYVISDTEKTAPGEMISLWAKSDSGSPTVDQTIAQIRRANGVELTIMYNHNIGNYLHVSTATDSKISDTSFTLTNWNHIAVKWASGSIEAVYVNGEDVMASGGTSVTGNTASLRNLVVGARQEDDTYQDFFDGAIDDVFLAIGGAIADLAEGGPYTACSPTLYRITTLPTGSFTVEDSFDSTDLNTTGKTSGNHTARLKKNGTTIVDAVVDLTADRDWSGITADASGNKAVVVFPSGQISTHGHNASSNPHTLYVAKGITTHFRVCPNATSLEEVSNSCTNGVVFTAGQTQSVTFPSGSSDVTVNTVNIGSTTYWSASGMLGSGGEGEDEGSAPDMGTWAMLILAAAAGGLIYWNRERLGLI